MQRKKKKLRDYIGPHEVVIKKHVIERYMERCGVTYNEALHTLERKFRNSKLAVVKPDGSELRAEVAGAMNKRLTFVAKKYGMKFVVITCYLQGPKRNWWKNEGLIINKPAEPVENNIQEAL